MNVYIARNNMQVQFARFRQNISFIQVFFSNRVGPNSKPCYTCYTCPASRSSRIAGRRETGSESLCKTPYVLNVWCNLAVVHDTASAGNAFQIFTIQCNIAQCCSTVFTFCDATDSKQYRPQNA